MLGSLLQKINPFTKRPHLAVVFVEYDRKGGGASDQTFALLQQYLSGLKGCRITYVRVDNKHEDMLLTKAAGNVFMVGGDNSYHEFSGWQRGIKMLASLQYPYDLALIANDMFLKPGPSFLQDYATPELLQKSLTENKIIGRIDTVFQNYTLFGYDVSSWVCTNCVFIPRKAAEALGNMVLINDNNIHEIFPHDYDPCHLISRKHFSLAGAGDFLVECDIPVGHANDIRVTFDTAATDQGSQQSNDGRPHIAMINEIRLNNQPVPEKCFVRGLFHEQETLWSAQSFLLDLSQDNAPPSHMVIKGCLPPETRRKIINDEFSIRVYNDAMLYQENAPINRTYQRGIVEWLTEKWHSRFEINHDTWELFKTKSTAIFNESLLTAKLRELGYPPETYGNKKYY